MKNGAPVNSDPASKSDALVKVSSDPFRAPTVYTPFHLLLTPALFELTPSLIKTRSPSDSETPSIVKVSAVASNPPSPSARTSVLEEAVDAIVNDAVVAAETEALTSKPAICESTYSLTDFADARELCDDDTDERSVSISTAEGAAVPPETFPKTLRFATSAILAKVTPESFNRSVSVSTSIDASSTLTFKTPLVAARPGPATDVIISAIVSFFVELSVASIIAIESLVTSTSAAVNSFRSTPRTALDAERPVPAKRVAISSIDSSWCVALSESKTKSLSPEAI